LAFSADDDVKAEVQQFDLKEITDLMPDLFGVAGNDTELRGSV
jgi:hypothetical protein